MQYSELCELYEKLENTSKRLEKTQILADFLEKLKKEKNKGIIYLLQGRVFPDYDERELGISEQLLIKALSKAVGISSEEIVQKWKTEGDLGKVAEIFIEKKKQSTLFAKKLSVDKVFENLRRLTEFTGKGTVEKKIGLIAELLTSASPLEARYIIRTVLQDLRTGTGTGVLRDAIVWNCFNSENKEAFGKVQEAYDKTSDFAVVFEEACKGLKNLEKLSLSPNKPVKVMLFPKVTSFEEAFKVVGSPCAIEFKYDGFRMLIEKDEKGEIRIFTRRLDNVTKQFPEVKKYVNEFVNAKTFIIDSEAVGYDRESKKYRPFQDISQRIRRKYDIEQLEKELPVEINVFDILYYNGKSLISEPFKKRRELIEEIIKEHKWKLVLAKQIITDSEEKMKEFYEEALKQGEEGIMIKKLDAPYKPGARVGYGVKLKPVANELDLVIVKAEYGTGKRGGWLTSFSVACRDGEDLKEVGKVSTGLKEKEEQGTSFIELTKLLKPLIKAEEGRTVEVKPKIVITVIYQEIQKSPSYSSGYALRFPRFSALRYDRNTEDIATLEEIKKKYDELK
jgi:DNA ligase-1